MFEEVPGLRIYVCMGVFPEADGRSEEGAFHMHMVLVAQALTFWDSVRSIVGPISLRNKN